MVSHHPPSIQHLSVTPICDDTDTHINHKKTDPDQSSFLIATAVHTTIGTLDIGSRPTLQEMMAAGVVEDEKNNEDGPVENKQGQQNDDKDMAELQAQVEALQLQLKEANVSNRRKDKEIKKLKTNSQLKKEKHKQKKLEQLQQQEHPKQELEQEYEVVIGESERGAEDNVIKPAVEPFNLSSSLRSTGSSAAVSCNAADRFIAEYLKGRLEKNQEEMAHKTLKSCPQVREGVEDLQRWLFTKGANCNDVKQLIIDYCTYCRVELGIPIDRLTVSGMMFHNDVSAYTWKWESVDTKHIEESSVPGAEWQQIDSVRVEEPFAALWGLNVREYRMQRGAFAGQVPSELSWFDEEQYYDYIALPVFFRGDYTGKIAWSTKSLEGFTKQSVEIIRRTMTAVSTVLRLHTNEIVVKSLTGELEEKVALQTQELANANKNLADANERVMRQYQNQLKHFAMMSHEIRTPLNCIIGLSNLLLDSDDIDEQSREQVELIVGSSDLLLAVVNDVLDYSKLATGRVDTFIEPTDVRKCIKNVTSAIRVKAHQTDLEIKERIHEDLPDLVLSDGRRIQQIMYNLLGNAVKFGKAGDCVELNVGVYPGNALGTKEYLKFAIKDYGTGISPEEMKNIFRPFQQSSSNDATHGGTGLGLAITRQLVRVLGGSITVDSEYGKWAEFVVKLPCVRNQSSEERLGTSNPLLSNLGERKSSFHSLLDEDESGGDYEDDNSSSSVYSSMSSNTHTSSHKTSNCSSSQYASSMDYSGIHRGYLNLEPVLFDTTKKNASMEGMTAPAPASTTSTSTTPIVSSSESKKAKSLFPLATTTDASLPATKNTVAATRQAEQSSLSPAEEKTPAPLFPIHKKETAQTSGQEMHKSKAAIEATDSKESTNQIAKPLFAIPASTTNQSSVAETAPPPTLFSLLSENPFATSASSETGRKMFESASTPPSPLFELSKIKEMAATTQNTNSGKDHEKSNDVNKKGIPSSGSTEKNQASIEMAQKPKSLFAINSSPYDGTQSISTAPTTSASMIPKPGSLFAIGSTGGVNSRSPSIPTSVGTAEVNPLFGGTVATKRDPAPSSKTSGIEKPKPDSASLKAVGPRSSPSKVAVPGCVVAEESFEGIKILVAEDNMINQKVLQRTLVRIGIPAKDITMVDNGKKAVDITLTENFDIILMDLSMPVMDGLEATKIITDRRSDSGRTYPKVVFLTAHALADYQERATEAGGDGFISKPFKIDTIKGILRALRRPKGEGKKEE